MYSLKKSITNLPNSKYRKQKLQTIKKHFSLNAAGIKFMISFQNCFNVLRLIINLGILAVAFVDSFEVSQFLVWRHLIGGFGELSAIRHQFLMSAENGRQFSRFLDTMILRNARSFLEYFRSMNDSSVKAPYLIRGLLCKIVHSKFQKKLHSMPPVSILANIGKNE